MNFNQLVMRALEPAASHIAGHQVQRLVGFWVLWHLFGGRQALLRSGLWSRDHIYRNEHEFERAFGVAIGDWMPEVAAMLGEPVQEPALDLDEAAS